MTGESVPVARGGGRRGALGHRRDPGTRRSRSSCGPAPTAGSGGSPRASWRPERADTPLQQRLSRLSRQLVVVTLALAGLVLVLGAAAGSAAGGDPRAGRQPGRRRHPGVAAGGGDRRPGPGRLPDGPARRPRALAAGGGDAGLGHRARLGQDRHPHRGPHAGAAPVDPPGSLGGQRTRVRRRRRARCAAPRCGPGRAAGSCCATWSCATTPGWWAREGDSGGSWATRWRRRCSSPPPSTTPPPWSAPSSWPRVEEIPFESRTQRMVTLHRGRRRAGSPVCKGAPEVVLELLADREVAGRARAAALDLAERGFRVLAVADARHESRPDAAAVLSGRRPPDDRPDDRDGAARPRRHRRPAPGGRGRGGPGVPRRRHPRPS